MVLKPIEEEEEMESKFKSEQSSKGKNDRKRNDSEKKKFTGNPCRKPGHNHEWNKCPDNYANRNEMNVQERSEGNRSSRARDSSRDKPTVNHEDQQMNWMDFSDTESDDSMPSLIGRGGSSDKSGDNYESDDKIIMSSDIDLMPGLTARVTQSDSESDDDSMPGLAAQAARSDSESNDDSMPGLTAQATQRDSESSDSEDDTVPDVLPRKESNIETNQKHSRDRNLKVRRRTARASVIFTLEDNYEKRTEYLGLPDTGSTGGLISKALVKKTRFETQHSNSMWDTNAGFFETGKTTFTKKLRFAKFTNKRVIRTIIKSIK
mmetsp:Transcript_44130/g.53004  ORF Transcript_44130/g.53004 Transcript_44130/m.53004 type:complete len:320 (+) Transcript_44130:564-1523(+)